MEPVVVFEDRQLLVVKTPPLWLAQGDGGDRPDVLAWPERYLKLAGQKPGRAFVGLCHRLDLAVGGLMVLAKTSKAARRICQAFRTRTVGKFYLALTLGEPPAFGTLVNGLSRRGRLTQVAPYPENGSRAELEYRVLAKARFQEKVASLLSVKLLTGFKHQIRAQLAAYGYPLVGDGLYGAAAGPSESIGLWAFRLELEHPIVKERLAFTAMPGNFWPFSHWTGPVFADLDYRGLGFAGFDFDGHGFVGLDLNAR